MAAASFVARAQVPMMLCSILPQRPEEQAWAFSFLPPPTFEVEARYGHLRDHTKVRRIGLLTDPTPYSQLMKGFATRLAGQYGLEIVTDESYKPDDADVNVQLGRMKAAGAGAVVKIGQGGSTVTVAKNIRQLGLGRHAAAGQHRRRRHLQVRRRGARRPASSSSARPSSSATPPRPPPTGRRSRRFSGPGAPNTATATPARPRAPTTR